MASLTIRKKLLILACELLLWAAFALLAAWLYPRWLVAGPNAPIHWVGMDFVPYWVGVRAMLTSQSPYSVLTTQQIQATLLGGPPAAGGDPMLFVYPAWIFLFILPWSLLPLNLAVSLWVGLLLLVMLHLLTFLALAWGGNRRSRVARWAGVLILGTLPYLSNAVLKGQLSVISLLAFFAAFRLVEKFNPTLNTSLAQPQKKPSISLTPDGAGLLAGMLLALSILKPNPAIIIAAGILLWALLGRKWGLLAGFSALMGVLILASLLAVGNWIPAYLAMLSQKGGAAVLWSLDFLRIPWNILFLLFFLGIFIFALIKMMRSHAAGPWFSASVLLGIALSPFRWIYDLQLGMLVPPVSTPLRPLQSGMVAIALLAPWSLALLPDAVRWAAHVTVQPLLWALAWLVCTLPVFRGGDAN